MEIVRLIIADIDFGSAHKNQLLKNMDDEQRDKALRFKNEKDQIRSLLSSYLMNQLSEEPLQFNEMGKPYYENGPCFNVSHSGKYVMIAVSTREIGIDIEENIPKDMSLLTNIFNEAEAKIIKEHADFYYLWCAKESLIKCIGSSISHVKEVPSLPFNGVKTFKGKDYQCQTFIYDKHIVSITRDGYEKFELKIEKVHNL